MLLIGAGLAALCIGELADSALYGGGLADHEALASASERLANVPSEFGDWTSTDGELTQREVDAAGIQGYVRREYRNDRTGYSVFLTILCGNAGPMSVHPPTACIQGVGYKLVSGPSVTTVKADGSSYVYEFNKSAFRQGDVSVPEIVRVFWAWAPDGNWKAPANPRFAFRGHSYLYKIYVTDSSLEDPDQSSLPQIEGFLNDALPVISEALTE